MDFKSLDPRVLEPLSGARAANADDHFVELYDDDASLVDSIRTFLSMGINAGDGAVVIATPDHRAAIEEALGRNVDLALARQQGVLEFHDAKRTLSLFMEDGVPDPGKFDRVIGEIIERVGGGGRRVRIFGEMVALLWMEGNVTGVLAVEDNWNRVAGRHRFRLFCAYPSRAFAGGDMAPLTGVCNRHSHVIVAPR